MSAYTRKYTPKACEGEDALFSGHVVLNCPAYEDRIEILSQHPEFFDKNDKKDKTAQTKKEMENLLSVMKWSYKFYQEVKITRISDKQKFNSLDDLRYSTDCQAILIDVSTQLAKGFVLGK